MEYHNHKFIDASLLIFKNDKLISLLPANIFDDKLIKKLLNLAEKKTRLSNELVEIQKKNQLLSTNLNLDYVDMIYREKLKFGKKDELIIKLKW